MEEISNPLDYADKLGGEYSIQKSSDHKKKYGQFLTIPVVAKLMSSYIDDKKKEEISILDPGIGTGILTIAVCLRLMQFKGCEKINIVGYEVDKEIISTLNKNLEYLKKYLMQNNVKVNYEIRNCDFVKAKAGVLSYEQDMFESKVNDELFDIIISNPPYFKINKEEIKARPLKRIVYGQPNIYAVFMAISSYLLKDDGDLIFITPRSYTSGYYFREFRKDFFKKVVPVNFHLFKERNKAFNKDNVLQEHLIIHAKKKTEQLKSNNFIVTITQSNGIEDLSMPLIKKVELKDVININSENMLVFLPLTDEDECIISKILSWRGSLHKYKMEISTGRVVPFRAKKYLCAQQNGDEMVPLIWMNHIKNNNIKWPLGKFRKEQYFILNNESIKLINRKSNYVLLRRFSAKEEKKRLNAAPLLEKSIEKDYLAFENHVNYIYKLNGKLTDEETMGLSEILNSKILDVYFRTHNGNTEVSATEIRDMPLPKLTTIKNIGKRKILNNITQEDVDHILLESE
jgi:adenine-specific DNA-methyltransferase